MTDELRNDLKDDLAYVKALAEEGRDTPLINGVFYVLWGGLIGGAAFLVYANKVGWIPLGGIDANVLFIVAFVAGWVLSFVIGARAGRKPGAATLGNQTAMSVWFAVGIFMSAFWLTLMLVHDNFTHVGIPPYFLFNLMFPIAFGVYGVAFFATATAARAGWLKWNAALAWVVAMASLAVMGTLNQLLIGAIGSFVCVVAPGVILMRREPSEIV